MVTALSTLGATVKNVGFVLKKHAPEIMIIGGIVGGTTATVLACIATAKAGDVVHGAKEELDKIKEAQENFPDEYTDEDAKKDRRMVYLKTTGKMAKLYAPAACIGTASICSILGGTGILNKRNASLAAGLAASIGEFEEYRRNLIEKFGDDGEKIDKELRYGLKEVEVKEKLTDGDGKTKTTKKKIMVVKDEDTLNGNGYSRVFDWRNPYWDKDEAYCEMFLKARQSLCNDKLRANGYIFLNDVLEYLGFPKTRVGQEVGWIYDPNNETGDNFVDFNMYNACVDVEGYRHVFMLDFNVDGSILNKVDWPDVKGGK